MLHKIKKNGEAVMEELMQYIKPELLAVAAVLFLLGIWIKKSKAVKDKYIPAILGALGVLICGIYVFATCPCQGSRGLAMGVFTAFTQGILTAGLSTYIHQLGKQRKKEE